jgi:hypothetical protein
MLVIAGTIEGIFSPQKFAPEVRLAVGGITAALLVLYFVVPNVQRERLRADSSI